MARFAVVALGLGLALTAIAKAAPVASERYPAESWERADPVSLGWSPVGLDAARRLFETLPPASVVIVDHGLEVAEWGDASKRIKISSMRKSILSALYGIYTLGSKMDLDSTLEQLGIDDDPPLSTGEKMATVRMLLEARSGVYHGYVAGTPGMRDGWPKRDSHAPGTFWFYNNWDFNALGTIFEKAFQVPIAKAFAEKIAKPTGMQDFREEDMYYLHATADSTVDFDKSVHPAYHFRMSARDIARFGYLFLKHGRWNNQQIIPADWISESTSAHSKVDTAEGYGYLWWIDGLGLTQRSFSAQGALAKYLVVVPDRELVVVYLNYAEFPDNAAGLTKESVKALPTISHSQLGQLLRYILEAQRSTN